MTERRPSRGGACVQPVYAVHMTFNPNAEIRSDNVRRGGGGGMFPGGRGGGIAIGGGGGCLLLAIILIYILMGGNPGDLLGGAQPQPPQQTSQHGGELTECQTGEDANTRDDCLVQATIESADDMWTRLAPEAGIDGFQVAQGRVFEGRVQTGCGPASSDAGPFYCPADGTIYVDVSFFRELSDRFGADGGQLAKEYVVAHEYGHHIQNAQGILTRADHNDLGPQGEMVRLELQADCYAGVWAHHASTTKDDEGQTMLQPLTEKDIRSGLSAASAVGDDHIQGQVAGGQVTPESWTHGSSEQRQTWFTRGYKEGTVAACDTFSAPEV